MKNIIMVLILSSQLFGFSNNLGVEVPLPGRIDMYYEREVQSFVFGIRPGAFSSLYLMTALDSLNTLSPSIYVGYKAFENDALDISPEIRFGIGYWKQFSPSNPRYEVVKSAYGISKVVVGYSLGRVKLGVGIGLGIYYFDVRKGRSSSSYSELEPGISPAVDFSGKIGFLFE